MRGGRNPLLVDVTSNAALGKWCQFLDFGRLQNKNQKRKMKK
jgi:hypothetical protein